MGETASLRVVDSLVLRFTGENQDGSELHELRATHVAEVLNGVAGLVADFDKAGVFNPDGPADSEVLVRPAEEGSFLIEVVRVAAEIWEVAAPAAAAGGAPTIGTLIWWATKSVRAEVKDYSHQDNGMTKVIWQDNTVDEIPRAAWDELQKRKRRRKKQLREIMAPMNDPRVEAVTVESEPESPEENPTDDDAPGTFTLTKPDFDAAAPSDEVEESSDTDEVEAQMSTIDFDNPSRWKVKTKLATRTATVEDADFLASVAGGLAIRKTDIFRLRIRADKVTKNGRTRTHWTVLQVMSHRRSASDDDA